MGLSDRYRKMDSFQLMEESVDVQEVEKKKWFNLFTFFYKLLTEDHKQE